MPYTTPRILPRARTQRLFVPGRRGSVLIMVVSLLVLLGLLGTAWIVVAREDRHTSQQNVANTQIDLLLEGVRNMAVSAIVNDLFGRGATTPAPYFRPRSDTATSYSFSAIDSPFDGAGRSDSWLAARVLDGGAWPAVSAPLMNSATFESPLGGTTSSNRTKLTPSFVTVGGRKCPAFNGMLAADTDGDGIADALLWRLPIGQINGISYFAATRIVDHNSALNASVAWKYNDDPATPLAGQFFPTNINLLSVLTGGAAEMESLNRWRFNNANASANLVPIDDAGAPRNDFVFISPYDALWMQLGRRLGNPGYNAAGVKYRPFSVSDTMALASGFVIRGITTGSALESALPASTNARITPYLPDQVALWTSENFTFTTSSFSRRAILVGSNPVQNLIQPASINGPGTLTPAHTAMAPYGPTPAKTSLNTAKFDELWRAYWNAMCDQPQTTPFGDNGSSNFNIYDIRHPQRMFRSSLRDVRYNDPQAIDAYVVRFEPFQQLLLRAALAAANTIDLRSSGRDVTSQRIVLEAMVNGAKTPVEVMVYGYQPQPFITEIFACTDTATIFGAAAEPNPKGYVAVELHNPYPFDIPLTNWTLAVLDRRQPGVAGPANPVGFKLAPLTGFAGFPSDAVVPANGYLVLENYRAEAADNDARERHPKAGTPANVFYVKNLHEVMRDPADAARTGGELVLLRPRRADGMLTSGPDFNETLIQDLVPADSFDFTGLRLPQGPTPRPPFVLYHYVRGSGQGQAWKWVYPGRYNGTAAAQRQEGAEAVVYDPATEPANLSYPVTLGAADASCSYPNPLLPIQLKATDWGPLKLAAAPNKFPFGAFARLGDLLQVPFIGRYRVRLVAAAAPAATGPASVLEMNTISMDSAFADDGESATDDTENVGRFCPILSSGMGVPVSSGGFDPTKGKPLVQNKLMWDPVVNGQTLENEVRGRFEATWTVTDLAAVNASGELWPKIRDGKGFQSRVRITQGTAIFRNCKASQVTREPGIHTDGFWIASSPSATGITIQWIDCMATQISGVPLLWENGSAKRLYIKNFVTDWKIEFKLMPGCTIDEIVIDGGIGDISIYSGGGTLNKLYVNNHRGSMTRPGGWQVIYGLPPDLENPTAAVPDHYAWAKKVFDYFTVVTNPADDYLPNIAPAQYQAYDGQAKAAALPAPQPVPNDLSQTRATANGGREDLAPVEGLVNINTAPWKVLAALPMLPNAADNESLAKAIADDRGTNGPFATLFDLYRVPAVQNAVTGILAGPDPDDADGDISPAGSGTDGVRGDFEERFLLLNRISNLVTTRSDTFTCWVVVQGWRGAGTANPELVVQRRAAFIVDRTPVSPTLRGPKVTNVPQN